MPRLLLIAVAAVSLFAFAANAEEFRPDDRVMFDVSAEDWVTTKTAHVTAAVEAAVSGNTAGTMRTDMMKAVGDLAKSDWRLTSFTRNQDQTGLEHWSAIFETRMPESDLGPLNDDAKKLSKPGMQLSIIGIDFTPTLDEMETARNGLRTRIYKIANDQLTALNAALPGRNYRIALINFTGDTDAGTPLPQVYKGRVAGMAMMAVPAAPEPSPAAPMERAEKVTLAARIVFAATSEPRLIAPTTAPPDLKR